jgi:hypothetical protein
MAADFFAKGAAILFLLIPLRERFRPCLGIERSKISSLEKSAATSRCPTLDYVPASCLRSTLALRVP